nr:hypothetical protein [Tanacetum cinerariifolium]
MNNKSPQTLPSFDSTCYSDKEISVPCVSKPNFVDESSNIFNPPPQPPIYSCEFCGSNAQYGHYCIPQAPFINLEPGYSQDFNFPQDIQQQVSEIKDAFENKQYKPEDVQDLFRKLLDNLQNIHEELAEFINSPGWNRPAVYDDDDDDVDYTIAITPVVTTEEPDNSLSIGDKHLDTILATESDEVLKSGVKDLVLILSEFKALRDNPTPSSEFLTKSSSMSPTPFLDGNNTFHNSLPEFENFCFDLEEISSGIEDDYPPLLAYVVWIFLAYLTYPVIPPHLHSFGNEDTIFDPGITINRFYSFKPGLSHRCGTFKKFNTHRSHLNESPMEMLFSILFPMNQ